MNMEIYKYIYVLKKNLYQTEVLRQRRNTEVTLQEFSELLYLVIHLIRWRIPIAELCILLSSCEDNNIILIDRAHL